MTTNFAGYDIQLILSIFIRILAVIFSVYIIRKIKDWRIALLTAMMLLMAVQQSFRLINFRSEIPGFFVSILGLLTAIFVGRLIVECRESEEQLGRLNENLEQRVAERTAALEDSNRKLTAALAEIKTLSGILPICSYCKKIRDDKGYWNQLETYISRHSDALFSHGYCPECAKKAEKMVDEFIAKNKPEPPK